MKHERVAWMAWVSTLKVGDEVGIAVGNTAISIGRVTRISASKNPTPKKRVKVNDGLWYDSAGTNGAYFICPATDSFREKVQRRARVKAAWHKLHHLCVTELTDAELGELEAFLEKVSHAHSVDYFLPEEHSCYDH